MRTAGNGAVSRLVPAEVLVCGARLYISACTGFAVAAMVIYAHDTDTFSVVMVADRVGLA
jgi:hypothetical protein